MHEYSIDSGERHTIVIMLGALGVGVAYLIAHTLSAASLSVPWWLDAPAAFGSAAILYWIFNTYLWRWSPLHSVGLVKAPDLRGTWIGSIESHGAAKSTATDVTLTIKQSWTRIAIVMTSPHSRSCSVVGAFSVNTPTPEVVYVYRNEPHAGAVATMAPHYGTATHRLNDAGDSFDGEYYTGRLRGTFGTITLRRQ